MEKKGTLFYSNFNYQTQLLTPFSEVKEVKRNNPGSASNHYAIWSDSQDLTEVERLKKRSGFRSKPKSVFHLLLDVTSGSVFYSW
jgi:hypothetical protein